MQRMSGLDAAFLSMETKSMQMHVVGVFVFDPSSTGADFSFQKVRSVVESRLHLLPPYRRRLRHVPFHLHLPLWIEDPDFDLDYHLRRACLPSPGGKGELANFAADIAGRPLDLNRPLWEMYVVEGVEHGQMALVTKIHHSAIDGVSGAELAVSFLDLEPNPPPPPPPEVPWKPDRVPTDAEMIGYACLSIAQHPTNLLRTARQTADMLVSLRSHNRASGQPPPPAPFSAPRTSFNASITAHRRFAMGDLPLDEVKRVKNAFRVTVNDVVLALCAGALRSYLKGRGELPDDPLVAMIPISVRSEKEKGDLGNRISAMLVSLATTVEDPVERLHAVADSTRRAKDQDRAIGADTLTNWTEFAAPAVAARAARLISSTRVFDRLRPMFNVTVSNVPGPDFPLYGAGAKLVSMYPIGPIVEGAGLNITVMSYLGRIFIGVLACRELVTEVDSIVSYMQASLAELLRAAGGTEEAVVASAAELNAALVSRPGRAHTATKADQSPGHRAAKGKQRSEDLDRLARQPGRKEAAKAMGKRSAVAELLGSAVNPAVPR